MIQVGLAAGLAVTAMVVLLVSVVTGRMHLPNRVGGGGTLNPDGVPAEIVPLITEAAGTCAMVSGPLLAAQLKQESNFRSSATSPVGAQGMAQFMPATWEAAGIDGNGDGIADPRDPADAIASQAAYDCDLAESTAGIPGAPINLMLAAYNAGAGAVQQYQGVPPYDETQGYVTSIRALMKQFTAADGGLDTGSEVGGGWAAPVPGAQLTSGFGQRWGRSHDGVDLAKPIGTPIGAAAGGTVIAAGPASGYGLWVKIDHGDGIVTIYGHVNSTTVGAGQTVKPGQQIATLGNRGHSTGPHLHFQIEKNGEPVDPEAFYQARGADIQ